MDFIKTEQFYESRYTINNPRGRVLRIGDIVIVHPTETSVMREPYPGSICKQYIKWCIDPCYEICMTAMNGYKYTAVMNEYMFMRLEPVKWMYNKGSMKNKIVIEGFKMAET